MIPVKLRATLLGGIALCCSGAAFAQQGPQGGPQRGPQAGQGIYVDAGVGADFLMDQKLKVNDGGFGTVSRTFSYDTGPAALAGIGYGFNNGLRVEVQGDYLNAHVSGYHARYPSSAGGYEQQYGAFGDVFYDFNLGLPIVPYVGAGAGAQAVELNRFDSGPVGYHSPYHGNNPHTHGAFAYQGIAGFAFPVRAVPGLSLTLEYRFIGVLSSGDYPFVGGGGKIVQGNLNDLYDHEVLAGIRFAFGAPGLPREAAATTSEAAYNPPPLPTAARTYLVFFDWDRADLSARARQIVAQAAAASTHVQTTRIEVNGYTDLSGTKAYNDKLSRRRAEAVQIELVRDGVSEDEITMHGFGESNPLVPTAPGVREPQNRRVEILLQ
jgi:outer membrane protein OmpA-like peptidoglycan-associated protein